MVPFNCWSALGGFYAGQQEAPKREEQQYTELGLELASFYYTVKYSPGKDNVAPDSFTRTFLAYMSISDLNDIHKALCHPGVTRMLHFVKTKNLLFSTEDVKKTCFMCRICAELKSQFITLWLLFVATKCHFPLQGKNDIVNYVYVNYVIILCPVSSTVVLDCLVNFLLCAAYSVLFL